MPRWIPFFPLLVCLALLVLLISKKRAGKWKRPWTFKWAMTLMTVAILLLITAAVLRLYNL